MQIKPIRERALYTYWMINDKKEKTDHTLSALRMWRNQNSPLHAAGNVKWHNTLETLGQF